MAEERTPETAVGVRFLCGDAFTLSGTELRDTYDLIYDSAKCRSRNVAGAKSRPSPPPRSTQAP
ncbi:hypothetical protein ACIRP7_07240 [Streptomyces sp. NPDC102270]|uniref:hypothetical protein n=1 Tax=Streptomyces sp. NPDC102270 TaxID=3366150 RepID=UPI0037F37312